MGGGEMVNNSHDEPKMWIQIKVQKCKRQIKVEYDDLAFPKKHI